MKKKSDFGTLGLSPIHPKSQKCIFWLLNFRSRPSPVRPLAGWGSKGGFQGAVLNGEKKPHPFWNALVLIAEAQDRECAKDKPTGSFA